MRDSDADEFTAFVLARSPGLLRTAFLLTGDRHAAEDLVQTALLQTLRHWRRIRDYQSLDVFVRQVMVNERRSWFRRRSSSEVPTDLHHDLTHDLGPPATDRVDDLDQLGRALKRLPRRQRATVVLRFFDDLSEPQVAEALGCTVGTVKSQTSKALAALRQTLGSHHHEGILP